MKFTHPSGKEITVEPQVVWMIGSSGRWFSVSTSETGTILQRTHGRLCGVLRRKMKRLGWTEVRK
jgi:hypothetical protein